MAQERTEEATPRRRQKSRERGQVARSQEVNTALVLLVGIGLLRAWGTGAIESTAESMAVWFRTGARADLTLADVPTIGLTAMTQWFAFAAPIIGGTMLAGVAASVVQTGFLISGHPLKPDLGRVNPLKGAKRLMSSRALVDAARSMGKIILIGLVFWLTVTDELDTLTALPLASVQEGWARVAQLAFDVALRSVMLLLAIALIDYWWQRRVHSRELRMTIQEVKEERKDTDGDPFLRGQQRARQREMASRRMLQEVPEADVVITNPIHYACALSYDATEMSAPVLVAKGQRLVAERIVAVAHMHRVPIVPNPPLARSLFASVEIGDEVPLNLYQAVAQVLAFVFRLRRAGVAA